MYLPILSLLLILLTHLTHAALPQTNAFFFGLNTYALASKSANIHTAYVEKVISQDTGNRVSSIATGEYHVLVKMENGALYSYGSNLRGALGVGPLPNSRTFTSDVTRVAGIKERVKSISARGSKSVVLTQVEDYIYEFGESLFEDVAGQGYAMTPQRVVVRDMLPVERFVSVVAAFEAAFVVSDQNRVFSFGRNQHHELGVSSGSLHERKDAEPIQQVFASGVENLVAGSDFVVLLEKDGKMWQWGRLTGPTGTNLEYSTPTLVTPGGLAGNAVKHAALSGNHIVYITQTNEVYHTDDNTNARRIDLPTDFTTEDASLHSLTCATDGTCSMLNGKNTAFVWTSHPHRGAPQNYGQVSSFATRDYSLHSNMKQVAHLIKITLFVNQDALSILGVGQNEYDLLGTKTLSSDVEARPLVLESREDSSKILEFEHIGSGKYHSIMLDVEGNLHSLGFNAYGALGDTENLMELYPHTIDVEAYCGEGDVKNVAAGTKHSVFLAGNGQVYAFGESAAAFGVEHIPFGTCNSMNFTQDIVEVCAGAEYNLALASDRTTLFMWGRNPITNAIMPPAKIQHNQFKNGIEHIYCGGYHHLALLQSGELYCWGSNAQGQCAQRGAGTTTLGVPRRVDVFVPEGGRILQVAPGMLHTLVMNSLTDVYAFGDNSRYQINTSERKVIDELYFVTNIGKLRVTHIGTTEDTSIVAVDADNGEYALFEWGTMVTQDKGEQKVALQRINNPCALTSLMSIASSYDGAYVLCQPYLIPSHPPLWKIAVVLVGVMGGLASLGLLCCGTVGSVRTGFWLVSGGAIRRKDATTEEFQYMRGDYAKYTVPGYVSTPISAPAAVEEEEDDDHVEEADESMDGEEDIDSAV